jgi:hypothetical protein
MLDWNTLARLLNFYAPTLKGIETDMEWIVRRASEWLVGVGQTAPGALYIHFTGMIMVSQAFDRGVVLLVDKPIGWKPEEPLPEEYQAYNREVMERNTRYFKSPARPFYPDEALAALAEKGKW